MPQNKKLTDLDAAQATKRVFDVEHDAIRATLAIPHEFELALRAEAGDSVSVIPQLDVVSGGLEAKCSRWKSFSVYRAKNEKAQDEGRFSIQLSPLDEGDFWFPFEDVVLEKAGTVSDVMRIAAKRMRIVPHMPVHEDDRFFIVGQS